MFFHYFRHHLLLFLKGMAMGAADVVPGVSGGTVAFITGIYEELIDSLRRFDLSALRVLFKDGIAACWNYVNGNFLLTLFSGILLSLFSLAQLIEYCFEHYPILLWSFFFGLVAASIIHVGKQMTAWNWRVIVALLVGIAAAVFVAEVKSTTELPGHWWVFSLAGAVAICAMILPGISGSYILLLMGLYSTFLQAISNFDIPKLASFAVGCVIGLMSFSHFIAWLLRRFHNVTLATLTGFLIGSLTLIWPWKQTVTTYLNRHGEEVAGIQANVLPWLYQETVGVDAQLLPALLLCFVGFVLVLGLEKIGKNS